MSNENSSSEAQLETVSAKPNHSESLEPGWILCEDGPLIAVNKPAGIITEGHGETLVSLVKQHLKTKYEKQGNVYLGIPHRLDRDTTGVVVFARNSKAASRLAEQFRDRTVSKVYWVLTQQPPFPSQGDMQDWLLKDKAQSFVRVVTKDTPHAKAARLSYSTLATHGGQTLVRVELETGRTHQIRVQFASRGWPVVGDHKYLPNQLDLKSPIEIDDQAPKTEPTSIQKSATESFVGLHSRELILKHPIRYDELRLKAPLPVSWPEWTKALSE